MKLELIDPRSPRVESIWRRLEARARPAYFLTWGWIETWLACLGDDAPRLAVAHDGDQPVAAWFLARRRRLLGHVMPTRTLFLNTSGDPGHDDLCVEHNQILAVRTLGLADWLALLPHGWDELVLDGLAADRFPGCALDQPVTGARVRIVRSVPSPYVDLAAVRAAGDYVGLLGSATRAQLRRARRGFGALEVEVARDRDQALAIYQELIALHAAHWRARGAPGAFADPWIDDFHRRLIARRFGHGEIQLLRVRAGGATIGCLYELVAGGRVLFYQSGLAELADPHLRAGYVCHAEAIARAAAAGHDVYDFLGGDHAYKQRLATGAARLVWARIQRPRLRFVVEDGLRRVSGT